ncbi:unnamed protein product [Fraxinus pennsylvanica]|uniref:acyl-CoA oxidase n=1 Tax=Fraxinus pennsylvanica TaxID=56036 RepID=A0AAD2EDB6_9LAMI|nr:unnamed protein product [Fraxinus pennsylvanica]
MEKQIYLLQFKTINSMEKVNFRTQILSGHLQNHRHATNATISASPCVSYVPPEVSEQPFSFDVTSMRKLMDGHNLGDRDWLFNLMVQSELFNPRLRGGKVFVMPDYNHSMEQQREMTKKRIEFLLDHGVFKGWLTGKGPEAVLKKFALLEVIEVRGIETTATYEANMGEFVINTPCESAQKYWIGGAANYATHAVVFSQLNIDGKNHGVHAFITQIRDENGNICPNIRIADCGHKIGLNGVDNGRIWYTMSFAGNYLKMLYMKRSPQLIKTIHVVSSAFKATLTWHNLRTLQECREACGGQGVKTENRIGQLKGEYDVQSTFEGDNNVLMQQVSKALLAEYVAAERRNKPFKELGLEHMNRSCPVIPAKLMSSTLRSTQFQNDIFCLRERDLLNRFAAEVSQYQAQGESKESAFVVSYQVAEDLGKAFSDRAILQCAIEAENNVTDASIKNILSLLRSMYALVTLEEDSAFLRYGYLSTGNAAAVRKEVAKLCSEIRPQALALVSSFGIPDAFLSPIAFDWVAANSWSTIEN